MKTKAIRLYGENDIRLEEFELPEITEDEVLIRVVSDSVCASTYKAIKQGPAHKRVPDNVAENPVIIGHEMCGQMGKVGESVKKDWKPGQTVVIQPALKLPSGYDPGYSYPFVGGNTQYAVVPKIVLERGCLLPFNGEGYFKGSLVESLGCIIRGYKGLYHTDYTNYVRTYSEENPTIGLLTREHIAPYNRLSASLTLSPVIGKWSPRWGVQVQRYDCKVETPQGVETFDNPLATLSWRNTVKFTDSFWINGDVYYHTKSQIDNTEYLENSWYMNINLYKGFLNNRISLQLQVTDLFNTRKSHVLMYSGLRTMELDDEMRRTISLTFRYKFNPTKSKYKVPGAGPSQKARMSHSSFYKYGIKA